MRLYCASHAAAGRNPLAIEPLLPPSRFTRLPEKLSVDFPRIRVMYLREWKSGDRVSLNPILMKVEKAVDILLVEDSAEDAELALNAIKSRKLSGRVAHVADGDE